jgi:hypothetical protein
MLQSIFLTHNFCLNNRIFVNHVFSNVDNCFSFFCNRVSCRACKSKFLYEVMVLGSYGKNHMNAKFAPRQFKPTCLRAEEAVWNQ